MRKAVLAAVAALALMGQSPYAPIQDRPIKALDAERVRGLQAGEGLAYALAAELNGFPGPLHAVELGARIGLSREQIAAARARVDTGKAEFRRLGAELVAAERALDAAFADRRIDPETLRRLVGEAARIDGELRLAHLALHLDQTADMTPEQIRRYMQARGYGAGGAGHGHGGHRHR
ncbi:MAG: hypothetical protein NBV67_04405 [Tagaea sp.]|nr:hypothetical protein [Tagaea sp.]